jgi:prepilin-type N-terminal cleavage/methylation domain-containing protein
MINSRERGFTLVELMIVVIIVAILTAVALPSYLSQIQKSRRAEAKSALTQISTMQQQFRTEQNRFTTDLTDLGLGSAGWNDTDNGYYEVSVVAATGGCPVATCFALQVRPKSGSAQEDDIWSYRLLSNGMKQRFDGSTWTNDWQK